MNDQVLRKSADLVDEEILEKYLCYEEKIKSSAKFYALRYLKIAATTACICIFILSGIVAFVLPLLETTPSDNSSYFTLQAYAQNGDLQELNLYEEVLNSGPTTQNIFDTDFPLFSFCITLSDENDNKVSFFDVEISVSYGGKDVTHTKDKHVLVSYMFPAQGYDGPYGFGITGWFEEPTDITILITDVETGDIIEGYTLNVRYLSEREEYVLTLTEKK